MEDELEILLSSFRRLQRNCDTFFVLLMGMIIFFMRCGFAFLEAGSVRSKNATNSLIKNLVDIFIAGMSYWLIGYPLAFGYGNAFCGASYWASWGLPEGHVPHWFFHFVCAAVASSIVSGAIAERCHFVAYLAMSALTTGIIYPLVCHWVWAPKGWLSVLGYRDFAGTGAIHGTGGAIALAGAALLGPRNEAKIKGHSMPMTATGGFILLAGFLSLNGGFHGRISHPGDAQIVGKAVFNTVIAGSTGGLCLMLLSRFGLVGLRDRGSKHLSFVYTLRGALTGMVSVSSCCNSVSPWASCLIGALSGPVYILGHWALMKFSVDDPTAAVPVHLGGGLWGILVAPFLQKNGILYGGPASSLAWNLIGALTIVVWSGGLASIVFFLLKAVGKFRVSLEDEMKGLDISKHGEPAYPVEAWTENQYSTNESTSSNIILAESRHQKQVPDWIPKHWTFPPVRRLIRS